MSSPIVPPDVNPEPQDKKRELDLKEREIAAKEREVAAKEKETSNAWRNPVVLGLFAAALGLAGNMTVAWLNAQSTQRVEHLHSQSTLILEAIKTGDKNTACNNLNFFVSLKLLQDTDNTIGKVCQATPVVAPSLPVDIAESHGIPEIDLLIIDSDKDTGIGHVEIELENQPKHFFSDSAGLFELRTPAYQINEKVKIKLSKPGYMTLETKIAVGAPRAVFMKPSKNK
jgi:hypothetical protein